MKTAKRKIGMLCVVFLGVALSVAARSGGVGTDEIQSDLTVYTPSTEMDCVGTDAGTGEVPSYPAGYTPPAELCYLEIDAAQEENDLVFGNLVIRFPTGVEAGVQEADGAASQRGRNIRLEGAEQRVDQADSYRSTGSFPPQIRVAHYTAEYDREEALICALLDLFPGGRVVQYEADEDNEYIFRLMNVDFAENCYAFVCGGDLYLVGEFEMEKNYSFSALWERGKVKWQDSGRTVEQETDVKDTYRKLTPEEDLPLLCQVCPDGLGFYLEGYYDSFYTFCEIEDFSTYRIEDVNFDGYDDISVEISLSSDTAFLWDPEKKEFTEMEYPEDVICCEL